MKKLIIYIVISLCFLPIIAQTESKLTVSEIRQQTIIDEPITLQKGYCRFGSGFGYYFSSIDEFDNDWNKKTNYNTMNQNSFYFPFNFRYGITNKFELDMSTGYSYSNLSDGYISEDYYFHETEYRNLNSIKKGFADLNIYATYKLLDEKARIPALAFQVHMKVPYGKSEITFSTDSLTEYRNTTEGYYTLGSTFLIKKTFFPFAIENIWSYEYNFPTDIKLPYDSEKINVKHGNLFDVNLAFHYLPCDWIDLANIFEFTSFAPNEYPNSKYDFMVMNRSFFTWSPQLTLQIKNLRLIQRFDFTIAAKNWDATPAYILILEIKI